MAAGICLVVLLGVVIVQSLVIDLYLARTWRSDARILEAINDTAAQERAQGHGDQAGQPEGRSADD